MENLLGALPVTFERIVTVSVPALVWITVLVGTYQLVRESLRRVHFFDPGPLRKGYVQRSGSALHVVRPQPKAGH